MLALVLALVLVVAVWVLQGWMVLTMVVRVGTVGRPTVHRKFRVRSMVRIVMHGGTVERLIVGTVGRLIVLGILIVRGKLPRLWVLVELWLVERAHV